MQKQTGINELGLTQEQALKLEIFKYLYQYIKSVESTFSITDTVVKWIKGV
jgi:hypothetical protein